MKLVIEIDCDKGDIKAGDAPALFLALEKMFDDIEGFYDGAGLFPSANALTHNRPWIVTDASGNEIGTWEIRE